MGLHEVSMQKEGCDAATATLEAKKGARVALKLVRATANLSIETQPAGLLVAIDGRPDTKAPLNITCASPWLPLQVAFFEAAGLPPDDLSPSAFACATQPALAASLSLSILLLLPAQMTFSVVAGASFLARKPRSVFTVLCYRAAAANRAVGQLVQGMLGQ